MRLIVTMNPKSLTLQSKFGHEHFLEPRGYANNKMI